LATAGATGGTGGSPRAVGPGGAGDEVHTDDWRLLHPKQTVAIEVSLLHLARLDGDLAVERSAQCVHDPAFDLRFRAGLIHDQPAIHGADDPVHANAAALVGRYFDEVSRVTPEPELTRDGR
jgi:hypothetical protein